MRNDGGAIMSDTWSLPVKDSELNSSEDVSLQQVAKPHSFQPVAAPPHSSKKLASADTRKTK